MRAKFKCNGVTEGMVEKWENGERVLDGAGQPITVKLNEVVSFSAVYSSDPTSENYAWSKATPSGSLSMSITNEAAFGHFKAGAEYYLDFFEAPAAR